MGENLMCLKNKIKSVLTRFYPIPTKSFYSEISGIKEELANLKAQLEAFQKNVTENVWANVFHDTIRESNWLRDKNFWPGRAALGYQAMYVTYRILNEIKPKQILELGLGQSTKLISQYAAKFKDVKHTVVENNQAWIDFFSNSYELPKNTEIKKLDWKIVPYENEEVRIFDGFEKEFLNQKFDFILVDAPLGADMKDYSRVDVLNIIPECLEENFVILVDDTDRIGEINTVSAIHRKLNENGINCHEGWYRGLKTSTIICSENFGFLATL